MKRTTLLLLICVQSVPASATDFLSADQIRQAVGGAEIAHVNPITSNHVTLEFHTDGTAGMSGGHRMTDSGQWWVTQGKQAALCFHFPTAGFGKTNCFRLSRGGNELVRYLPNGRPAPGVDFAIVGGSH